MKSKSKSPRLMKNTENLNERLSINNPSGKFLSNSPITENRQTEITESHQKKLLNQLKALWESHQIEPSMQDFYLSFISKLPIRQSFSFLSKEINDFKNHSSLLLICLNSIKNREESLKSIQEMDEFLKNTLNWHKIHEVKVECIEILNAHRLITLTVAENIEKWMNYLEYEISGIETRFMVKGEDYLEKMKTDLEFLKDTEMAKIFKFSQEHDPFLILLSGAIEGNHKYNTKKGTKNEILSIPLQNGIYSRIAEMDIFMKVGKPTRNKTPNKSTNFANGNSEKLKHAKRSMPEESHEKNLARIIFNKIIDDFIEEFFGKNIESWVNSVLCEKIYSGLDGAILKLIKEIVGDVIINSNNERNKKQLMKNEEIFDNEKNKIKITKSNKSEKNEKFEEKSENYRKKSESKMSQLKREKLINTEIDKNKKKSETHENLKKIDNFEVLDPSLYRNIILDNGKNITVTAYSKPIIKPSDEIQQERMVPSREYQEISIKGKQEKLIKSENQSRKRNKKLSPHNFKKKNIENYQMLSEKIQSLLPEKSAVSQSPSKIDSDNVSTFSEKFQSEKKYDPLEEPPKNNSLFNPLIPNPIKKLVFQDISPQDHPYLKDPKRSSPYDHKLLSNALKKLEGPVPNFSSNISPKENSTLKGSLTPNSILTDSPNSSFLPDPELIHLNHKPVKVNTLKLSSQDQSPKPDQSISAASDDFISSFPSLSNVSSVKRRSELESSLNAKNLFNIKIYESIVRNYIEKEIELLNLKTIAESVIHEEIIRKSQQVPLSQHKRLSKVIKAIDIHNLQEQVYNSLISEFLSQNWLEALATNILNDNLRFDRKLSLRNTINQDVIIEEMEEYVHEVFTPGIHSPNHVISAEDSLRSSFDKLSMASEKSKNFSETTHFGGDLKIEEMAEYRKNIRKTLEKYYKSACDGEGLLPIEDVIQESESNENAAWFWVYSGNNIAGCLIFSTQINTNVSTAVVHHVSCLNFSIFSNVFSKCMEFLTKLKFEKLQFEFSVKISERIKKIILNLGIEEKNIQKNNKKVVVFEKNIISKKNNFSSAILRSSIKSKLGSVQSSNKHTSLEMIEIGNRFNLLVHIQNLILETDSEEIFNSYQPTIRLQRDLKDLLEILLSDPDLTFPFILSNFSKDSQYKVSETISEFRLTNCCYFSHYYNSQHYKFIRFTNTKVSKGADNVTTYFVPTNNENFTVFYMAIPNLVKELNSELKSFKTDVFHKVESILQALNGQGTCEEIWVPNFKKSIGWDMCWVHGLPMGNKYFEQCFENIEFGVTGERYLKGMLRSNKITALYNEFIFGIIDKSLEKVMDLPLFVCVVKQGDWIHSE